MSKVVILSGAGISAESGIKTFRDSDGLWNNHDVEEICSVDSLENNEGLTINFYDERRKDLEDKIPNLAHIKIAELKNEFPNQISVITQNIDNLFEKAGLQKEDVIHLHGFLTEVKCQDEDCSFIKDIGYELLKSFNKGKCPKCNRKLRPNVVFFGEEVPEYSKLYTEINDCKLLVIIGTSGSVVNVDSLVVHVEKSILNNLEPSKAIFDELYTRVLYMPATKAISEISRDIRYTINYIGDDYEL